MRLLPPPPSLPTLLLLRDIEAQEGGEHKEAIRIHLAGDHKLDPRGRPCWPLPRRPCAAAQAPISIVHGISGVRRLRSRWLRGDVDGLIWSPTGARALLSAAVCP